MRDKMDMWEKENLCKNWNELNPIGTQVIVTDDLGGEHETVTISEADMLGGHTPVISTEWKKCYLLTRVRIAKDTDLEQGAYICPHCGYRQTDIGELGEGEYEMECGSCCQLFDLSVAVSYYYSTKVRVA